MRLRWTEGAANDLQRISDYLFEQNPAAAASIIRRIYAAPARLTSFPQSGRAGRQSHTREIVIPNLPFIVVYDTRGDDVVRVLRILHAAQKWP